MEKPRKPPPIGEARHQAMLDGATVHPYRTFVDGRSLSAYCYGIREGQSFERTGLVFFHSGLWEAGHPSQFVPQCLHFASRDCFAMTVEYRLTGDGVSPVDAINDAQTAVLWLKRNAHYFGVDPDKVVAVGGAAGGCLALSSALLPEGPSHGAMDCRPAAVGCFSGLYDTTPRKGVGSGFFENTDDARSFSPTAWVRKGLPPLFMAHGKKDRLISFDQAKRFARAYRRRKNRVDLLDFEGAEHSFFNFNVSEHHFEVTVDAFDAFLVSQGFLKPDVVI